MGHQMDAQRRRARTDAAFCDDRNKFGGWNAVVRGLIGARRYERGADRLNSRCGYRGPQPGNPARDAVPAHPQAARCPTSTRALSLWWDRKRKASWIMPRRTRALPILERPFSRRREPLSSVSR